MRIFTDPAPSFVRTTRATSWHRQSPATQRSSRRPGRPTPSGSSRSTRPNCRRQGGQKLPTHHPGDLRKVSRRRTRIGDVVTASSTGMTMTFIIGVCLRFRSPSSNQFAGPVLLRIRVFRHWLYRKKPIAKKDASLMYWAKSIPVPDRRPKSVLKVKYPEKRK